MYIKKAVIEQSKYIFFRLIVNFARHYVKSEFREGAATPCELLDY